MKRRRAIFLLLRRLDSSSLAAVKRLSSKDRSIVVVVEAKGCQLTSKFSSFQMQTKPVDAEERVLAAI